MIKVLLLIMSRMSLIVNFEKLQCLYPVHFLNFKHKITSHLYQHISLRESQKLHYLAIKYRNYQSTSLSIRISTLSQKNVNSTISNYRQYNISKLLRAYKSTMHLHTILYIDNQKLDSQLVLFIGLAYNQLCRIVLL